MNQIEERKTPASTDSSGAAKRRGARAAGKPLDEPTPASSRDAPATRQERATPLQERIPVPQRPSAEPAARTPDAVRNEGPRDHAPASPEASQQAVSQPAGRQLPPSGMVQQLRRAFNTVMGRPERSTGPKITAGHDQPRNAEGIDAPATKPMARPSAKDDKAAGSDKPNDATANGNKAGYEIPRMLRQMYYISEHQYFFRDRQQALAFEDKGQRIATAHDDASVARSMVELAAAKGWQGLRIKGSEAFKREAWLAAAERGLETTGYRPKAVDRARLQERLADREAEATGRQPGANKAPQREAPANNHIERMQQLDLKLPAAASIESEGTAAAAPPKPVRQAPLNPQQEKAIDVLRDILSRRGDAPQAIALTTALAQETLQQRRAHAGKLVAHGHAPYMHNPKEQDSYYVVLQTQRGEKTVWGIDLKEQFEKSKLAIGTDVVISRSGRQPVTVQGKDRSDDPQRKGTTVYIDTLRNQWQVDTVDDMRNAALGRGQHSPAALPRPPLSQTPGTQGHDAQQVMHAPPAREPIAPQR